MKPNQTQLIQLAGLVVLSLLLGCHPKPVASITDQLGRIWRAQTVKEGDVLVYTQGGSSNTKPGYASFRLDLSQPGVAKLTDIDGRLLTGTWTISTNNQRLILADLNPRPTNTGGTIEYYIVEVPTSASLKLERTAESRKTGNSLNQYGLVPE
ncbi:hypothetical protein [Spirosoma rhododendri]|uniref:Lipocalin-like domain-containing protein n=1 Tax=Spirosoma rhododendri TaxID=2728024 RepID=A0A7L5DS07_9BACT|nr:hypothetical protein [Spirosoma rhododendri]QJD80221.1 hypothetical protein HH216_18710 [Spirosoma rhododendri]